MNSRIRAAPFLVALATSTCAQVIPAERTTAWSSAGLTAAPPAVTLSLDITFLGGSGDGATPNDAAVIDAFNAAQGQMTAVYFPPGQYLFTSPIEVPDSVIIRGAGADSTTLTFALGGTGHCIKVAGVELSQHYPITEGAARGNTHLSLGSTDGLTPGSTARLYRNDTALVESWWAEGSAGQIVRIGAVQPDGIDLEAPLRAAYAVDEESYLVPMRPASGCGIECLRVERTDAPTGQFSNIWFYAARDCWVRGVESVNCGFAHIELYTSANCEVSGCWAHHAFNYGSGGQGYGVLAYLTAGGEPRGGQHFRARAACHAHRGGRERERVRLQSFDRSLLGGRFFSCERGGGYRAAR